MIVDFDELKEIKKRKETVVMQFLIGYYKNMADTTGVDIPYFIRARDTYKELIHNIKDLNRYYGKLQTYNK